MGIESPVHLLFIAVVALIVLGPKRLPGLARALGQGIREFRGSLEDGANQPEPPAAPPPPAPVSSASPDTPPAAPTAVAAPPTPGASPAAPGPPAPPAADREPVDRAAPPSPARRS